MSETLLPTRGVLLVRPIASAERLPGGLIVLTADTRERLTANQCEVLAVGAFAECEDEECERRHELEWLKPCTCNEETQYAMQSTNSPCACNVRVHPHTVRPGDWILCAPRSVLGGPDAEKPERFVHQDAVWGIFNSTETTT